MISVPPGVRAYLGAGATDIWKGFDDLAIVCKALSVAGDLFAFREHGGDRARLLYFDGQRLCLFAKQLECGRFIWLTVG